MGYRRFATLEEVLIPNLTRLRSQRNYLKVQTPARPARARTVGYKNDGRMVVVQARIQRGGIRPSIPVRGRSPGNLAKVYSRKIALDKILAQRVARKFKNLNVLNYYPLGKDGQYLYGEYILYQSLNKDKGPRPKSWIFR